MIVAINYANWKYKKAQRFNSRTAVRRGKANKVIEYAPSDLDKAFRDANKDILSQQRGNGYWLWKPYIILNALGKISKGDYLVYLDSGAFYINSIKILTDQMERDGQYIMSFELPFKEKRFTKRDVFVCMGCDNEDYTETNQRMATMVVLKKCSQSIRFVREWLYYGQKEGIITDAFNHLGYENYRGFVDNRHDQSIFSLLCKKYGVRAYRDPSQMGRFPDIFFALILDRTENACAYPQIIAAHKCESVSRRIYREQLLYAYAPKIIVELYYAYFGNKTRRVGDKKIAMLTDNMPICAEKYGYGMYKVVNGLAEALGGNLDTIICTDRNFQNGKMSSDIRRKVLVANKFHADVSGVVGNIRFLIEIFPIACSLKKKDIRHIFIPLGADYRELERAYLISIVFHFKISIYVVDDFVKYYSEILKKDCGGRNIEKRVARYINQADVVFSISDGMRKRIWELCGRNSYVLPIPYHYMDIGTSNVQKSQIMYVGGINELYSFGLRDIAEIIDELNMENQWNIQLKFTYRNIGEVKYLLGNFACIRTERLETEYELRREIHSSLFCFMPYSDKDSLHMMQQTSFPSKMIEYLGAAKSIVVYGNRQNSASSYFNKYGLSTVIDGRDKEKLRKCIVSHLQEEIDYSSAYKDILKRVHSYKRVREILLGNI